MARPISQGGIDYPDGGFPSGSGMYAITGDLAEQVARLGGYPGIDRSGNVVLYDDFRYGISTSEIYTAGLGEITGERSTDSRFGGYTIILQRVANVNSYAGLRERVVGREYNRVGTEALFTATAGGPNVKLFIYRYTGTAYYLWGLRWDSRTDTVYIGSDSGGWTEIATGVEGAWGLILHQSMKLVVDTNTNEYVRVIINGVNIDISDVDVYTESSTVAPHVVINFVNGYSDAVATALRVDVIIVTTNEY